MDTGITVAVLLAMIVLGAYVIRLLNDRHAERITLHRYSRRLPGSDGVHSSAPPQPVTAGPPAVRARRDHRDGGRGRLRPRRRDTGTRKSRKA